MAKTFVAFQRAINLGATRRFGKDDLAAVTTAAGFGGVATYLNTGNVRIETTMRSTSRIERRLEAAYAEFTGFEVPTMVFGSAELSEVLEVAEDLGAGHEGKRFVALLKRPPEPDQVAALESRSTEKGQVHVVGRVAHLLLGESYLDSGIDNAVMERHVGPATTRTIGVIRTVVERWCSA